MTLEISTTRGLTLKSSASLRSHIKNFHNGIDSSLLAETIPLPELRRQDDKNRQNSIDDIDPFVVQKYQMLMQDHFQKGMELYQQMLNDGIAKECSRFVLPLAVPTKMYMTETNSQLDSLH